MHMRTKLHIGVTLLPLLARSLCAGLLIALCACSSGSSSSPAPAKVFPNAASTHVFQTALGKSHNDCGVADPGQFDLFITPTVQTNGTYLVSGIISGTKVSATTSSNIMNF